MFEVSFGELTIVIGLGLALVGRKDLPRAARLAGTQVGRLVGLLQGARARADRFAAQNELKQLQNELRSGLRELDAVKAEFAVSMSGKGMIGRTLGSTVPGVNKATTKTTTAAAAAGSSTMIAPGQISQIEASERATSLMAPPSVAATAATTNMVEQQEQEQQQQRQRTLPPVHQTIAAVAEEEWQKQGIAFQSRAERGAGLASSSSYAYDHSTSGSVLLANLVQQSLIFDQYDRVVQEQDDALQSKIDSVQEKQQQQSAKKAVLEETKKED